MSIDDLLQELQLEYIQSIPQKISELKAFYEVKDLDNLTNSFHKLKGSGKTYGLDEISVIGQFFEIWLRKESEKVVPFIPTAISILEKIYSARSESKPYVLESDQEFQKLQSLA